MYFINNFHPRHLLSYSLLYFAFKIIIIMEAKRKTKPASMFFIQETYKIYQMVSQETIYCPCIF